MSWFSKKHPQPEEKSLSEYRIVPRGEKSWGIQRLKDIGYEDVFVSYTETSIFFAGFSPFTHYPENRKYWFTGTMEEAKEFIDRVLKKRKEREAIAAREADISLYLDYP